MAPDPDKRFELSAQAVFKSREASASAGARRGAGEGNRIRA